MLYNFSFNIHRASFSAAFLLSERARVQAPSPLRSYPFPERLREHLAEGEERDCHCHLPPFNVGKSPKSKIHRKPSTDPDGTTDDGVEKVMVKIILAAKGRKHGDAEESRLPVVNCERNTDAARPEGVTGRERGPVGIIESNGPVQLETPGRSRLGGLRSFAGEALFRKAVDGLASSKRHERKPD